MAHSLTYFEKHSKRIRHHFQTHRWIRNSFLILGGVILVWGVVVGIVLAQIVRTSSDAANQLTHAKEDALLLHFDSATRELRASQQSFALAERLFPILKTAEWIPLFGSTIRASGQLIVGGKEAAVALEPVVQIGSDVLQLSGLNEQYFTQVQEGISPRISFSDLPSETKEILLQRLQAAAETFSLLSKRIELVRTELDRITRVGIFTNLLDPFEQSLRETQTSLNRVSRFAFLLPAFAGVNHPQNFLVLFLNNTELRPGGGFIGTYGILSTSKGEVTSFKTADVYALDRLVEKKIKTVPPYPLQKYNATPIWFFRDANWSPDFSVSADGAVQKYLEETALLTDVEKKSIPYADRIDGVIGITPTFAEHLLKQVGSVTVAGQTFTSDNITDTLEYQVEYGYAKQGIPLPQRKEIIAALVDEVMSRLMKMTLLDWGQMIQILEQDFQSKQFLVSHADESVQAVLSNIGWNGSIKPTTPDVQLVVDANLASLKSDPAVKRNIRYEVFKNTNKDWIGRTTVEYQHTGTFDWKTSTYRTYVRLYTPKGTTLVRVTGSQSTPDTSEELGMQVFGTFVTIAPGSKKDVVFEYVLPDQIAAAISAGTYTLTYFKQPGAQNYPLTLHLDFDKNVLHATPPEEKNAWGDSVYQIKTLIDQNRLFEVKL